MIAAGVLNACRAAVLLGLICAVGVGEAQEQAEPKIVTEPALIETLNQASLQSAFQMLRQHYLEKDTLSLDLLNRIALRGLLDYLGTGAELVPEDRARSDEGSSEPGLRLVSELLTNEVAYVRPASLSGEELKRFDSVLVGFQRSPAKALVLDLRCPGGADRFRNVADFASRFLATGTPLFRLERPGDAEGVQEFKSRKGQVWTELEEGLPGSDTSPEPKVDLDPVIQSALDVIAASLRLQES
jgi:hypothetical protein